jgi:hypothetical protein
MHRTWSIGRTQVKDRSERHGILSVRRASAVGSSVQPDDDVSDLHCGPVGPTERLLSYRLGMTSRLLPDAHHGTLLENGCGTAIHLLALADGFDYGIGTDASPATVNAARRLAHVTKPGAGVSLRVDPA